jgi:hypothetical protein
MTARGTYTRTSKVALNSLIDPSLGMRLVDATGIGDDGYISVDGTDPSGQTEAFLLTPNAIPEASSLVNDRAGRAGLAPPTRPRPTMPCSSGHRGRACDRPGPHVSSSTTTTGIPRMWTRSKITCAAAFVSSPFMGTLAAPPDFRSQTK